MDGALRRFVLPDRLHSDPILNEKVNPDDPTPSCQNQDSPPMVAQDESRQHGHGGFVSWWSCLCSNQWTVGLSAGSSGEGQSANTANLTITAVASPAASNLLYPGGNGDVVVTISNTNPYPVSISALQLPTNTTYANGYTTSALSVPQVGCLASTPSDVIWNYSTAASGSSHSLTSTLTVAASGQANNPLTVTFTNDASMTAATPAACINTYFSMPSLTGVTATGGAAPVTTSPATDAWTS
jgi:hypothetical protein